MTTTLTSAFAASSSAPVYSGGVYRGETWFNRGNPANILVADKSCDAMGVYAVYRLAAPGGSWGSWHNQWDNDGCGSGENQVSLGNNFVIEYYTCVDDGFQGFDTCSGHVVDSDPP